MAKTTGPRTLAEGVADLKKKIQKQSKKSKAWRVLFVGLFGVLLAAWVAAVLYGVQFAVAFVFVRLLSSEQLASNTVNAIYQVIVYALALLVTIGLPWKILKRKTTRDELGLRGLPTWTDLLLAPIGFIVTIILSAALTAVMMALLPGIEWEQAQNVGYNKNTLYQARDFILAFTCLVVLAPVCEEIIFRGWLYGKLRFRMPAVPAILITSLLFGIVHGQWNVGVTVFAMSIGMCVMRELTGTIWGGILLHMIKNGLAFYFLFVA